jgi:integrase/recombinase XerD
MANPISELADVQLVERYLHFLDTRRHRRPLTLKTYRRTLRLYLAWLDGLGLSLSEVDHDTIEDFGHRTLVRGGQPSISMIRKDIVTVRAFHTWANDRGASLLACRTAVAPRPKQAEPNPVDDDVWRHLWGSDLDPHDRLWLGLGYFCGLRRIEITTCKPTDVRVQQEIMMIERKGAVVNPIEYVESLSVVDDEMPHLTLGRSKEWLDLLHEEVALRSALGATFLWYDSEGDPDLDGNRLNKRLLNDRNDGRVIGGLLPRLGLPPKSVTPHRLRHSFATNLFRGFMPLEFVQAQMGHTSSEMTRRYARTSGEMARWRAREKGRVSQ